MDSETDDKGMTTSSISSLFLSHGLVDMKNGIQQLAGTFDVLQNHGDMGYRSSNSRTSRSISGWLLSSSVLRRQSVCKVQFASVQKKTRLQESTVFLLRNIPLSTLVHCSSAYSTVFGVFFFSCICLWTSKRTQHVMRVCPVSNLLAWLQQWKFGVRFRVSLSAPKVPWHGSIVPRIVRHRRGATFQGRCGRTAQQIIVGSLHDQVQGCCSNRGTALGMVWRSDGSRDSFYTATSYV